MDKLDPEILAELKEAFQLFDSDEDGLIDAKELKAAFKALGVEVKTADARKMLLDMGRDEDAGVSFDVFLELIAARLPDRDSPEEVRTVTRNRIACRCWLYEWFLLQRPLGRGHRMSCGLTTSTC